MRCEKKERQRNYPFVACLRKSKKWKREVYSGAYRHCSFHLHSNYAHS